VAGSHSFFVARIMDLGYYVKRKFMISADPHTIVSVMKVMKL
jgi:hypothetical protein